MARDWADSLKVAGVTPMYHRVMIAGLPALGMLFHPFGLAGDVMFEFDPFTQDRYDLFDVRYVVAPHGWAPPEFLLERKRYTRYVLYEYLGASPVSLARLEFEGWGSKADAARFMGRWVALGVAARGVYGEIVPGPTGKMLGMLFSAPYLLPLNTNSRPVRGEILRSTWRQHAVEAQATLEEGALVVFKVGYHPRWELMVNGEKADTIRVTPGFVGVELPAGEHRLDLRYRPSRSRGILFFLCLSIPLLLSRTSKRDGAVCV
jgi:hypothetical protein